MPDHDTIVAIGTAAGESALGVVRLSGPLSSKIMERLFVPAAPNASLIPRVAHHGRVRDPASSRVIDEVLVCFFPSPASYTGEDVLEISGHGSMVALRLIVDVCRGLGARMAEPGEFTKRAFLNGKLSLDEAEAVADVISAQSDASLHAAQQHLSGAFAAAVEDLRSRITHLMAHVEASLDFPDDEIEAIGGTQLASQVHGIADTVSGILDTFQHGRILREGLNLVLAGPPNAGKSSLLNALLRYERALVTPIPGTTRDTVEESLLIKGIPVKAIDTAGLRVSDDLVERLGVERARKRMQEADIVILVLDMSEDLCPETEEFLMNALPREPAKMLCLNKMDLPRRRGENADTREFAAVVPTSALMGEGINLLEAAVADVVSAATPQRGEEMLIVARLRHRELLEAAKGSLVQALKAMSTGAPLDCVSIDLRDAFNSLGQISGGDGTEDLLDAIFSEFCIGK